MCLPAVKRGLCFVNLSPTPVLTSDITQYPGKFHGTHCINEATSLLVTYQGTNIVAWISSRLGPCIFTYWMCIYIYIDIDK